MMNNSNMTSLSSLEAGEECYGTCNETAAPTNNSSGHNLNSYILQDFIHWLAICLICSFGFLGNGNVIWLLGFRMKRNPFTTFILNLAVADFGVLLCLFMLSTFYIVRILFSNEFVEWWTIDVVFFFFFFTCSISQVFLAAISIDRCVSVLFPIWHRCHRPTHLSTTVCALIWGINFLFIAIQFIFYLTAGFNIFYTIAYQCVANALLCLPLMAISSLILFIKVCFKSRKHHRMRLLRTILLTLLFFLMFAFPLNAFTFFYIFGIDPSRLLFHCGYIGASLNSSVNPLIYFLVGRKKKSQSRENMKAILQRVFKEEEERMESAV